MTLKCDCVTSHTPCSVCVHSLERWTRIGGHCSRRQANNTYLPDLVSWRPWTAAIIHTLFVLPISRISCLEQRSSPTVVALQGSLCSTSWSTDVRETSGLESWWYPRLERRGRTKTTTTTIVVPVVMMPEEFTWYSSTSLNVHVHSSST